MWSRDVTTARECGERERETEREREGEGDEKEEGKNVLVKLIYLLLTFPVCTACDYVTSKRLGKRMSNEI